MRDTELMAKWFENVGARVREQIGSLDEDALEWRADDRGNNVRETVWHMARWIDLLTRVLDGTQPSTERWFTDGWAQRTGYDPRGVGDSGLGTMTGYTFEEVLKIPRLDATELIRYLDSVVGPLAQRLRALPDDEAAARSVRRVTGILQGCFSHVGEIDALLAIRERSAQRASA
ncbi:MAG TPA: DinB family protein [Candidatus Polarisedimenticolia bacterium]|nr:DinB family protein [Candidatus Polarisedimenticolia bacterium]